MSNKHQYQQLESVEPDQTKQQRNREERTVA